MMRVRDNAVIDSCDSDLDPFIGGLRPEGKAVVLAAAARQIAAGLEDRRGIDAVHVIAYGTSGRASFAPGDRSPPVVDDGAEDVTAIGRALGDDDSLELWSRCAGAGTAGPEFVARLAQVMGAQIAPTGRL